MESVTDRATERLYNLSIALNTIDDLEASLACVVAFTQEALACGRVSIMLLEGDVLRIRAATGLSDDLIESSRIPIGERVSGEVFRSGQAVLVKDVESLPYVERSESTASDSYMSSPILYAGLSAPDQPLGVINVTERDGNRPFSEADLELLTYIANTASIAIHNHTIRNQLQSAYAEARAQADVLAEANDRLEILERLKTDFLSFIAHELRTPLSELSAVGLLDEGKIPREQVEVIEALRGGYERLEKFIQRALEYFSWVGTGDVITSETTNLGALTRTVAGDLPALAEPGVDFRIKTPETPAIVRAPEREMATVVRTLLDNALKFSPDEKSIDVDFSTKPGFATLAVTDRGRGFPPEWAAEIFRPFTIVDPMHHGRGTALSLAMAKAIVEAYGGRMTAESAGLGKGAAFTVELPAATPGNGGACGAYSLRVSR
jgi:signal transduction histidine kinase